MCILTSCIRTGLNGGFPKGISMEWYWWVFFAVVGLCILLSLVWDSNVSEAYRMGYDAGLRATAALPYTWKDWWTLSPVGIAFQQGHRAGRRAARRAQRQ
jgi:hypothetical protein